MEIDDFKGTKTTWHVLEFCGTFLVLDGDYYEARNILDFDDVLGIEAKANALLIEKSLELLETLIELHKAVSSGNPHELSKWNLKAKTLTCEILK